MKSKDFEIYKEGHLEGYKIGLRDMANYERRFKLEEYKNRTIFLLVLITGIGNILYFIFYHHHNVYVRLSFHLISFLLFFVYLYFLGKDYILDKNKNPVCLEKLSKQNYKMKKETIWHDEEVKKGQKQEEFECDCCGRVLTPTQMKIEKKINTDLSPCFCNIIIELDKKNKLIKKLKKFKEIKTETKPINIKFKTKDGKNVSFKAVKVVKKKNKNAPTLKNENQKLFKLRNH